MLRCSEKVVSSFTTKKVYDWFIKNQYVGSEDLSYTLQTKDLKFNHGKLVTSITINIATTNNWAHECISTTSQFLYC